MYNVSLRFYRGICLFLVLLSHANAQHVYLRTGTGLQKSFSPPIEPFRLYENWIDIKFDRANHDYMYGTIGFEAARYFRAESNLTVYRMGTTEKQYQVGFGIQLGYPIRTFKPYFHSGIFALSNFEQFAPSLGFGLEANFGKHTALFIEKQHLLMGNSGANFSRNAYTDIARIHGGFVLHLGRKRNKKPTPKPETIEEPAIVALPLAQNESPPNQAAVISKPPPVSTPETPTEPATANDNMPNIAKSMPQPNTSTPTTSQRTRRRLTFPTRNNAPSRTSPPETNPDVNSNASAETSTNITTNTSTETKAETSPNASRNVISAQPSILAIEAAAEGRVNEPITFSIKLSGNRRSQRSTEVEWNFQDGTIKSGNPVKHAFAEPQFYTITAIARNEFGADTTSVPIWIKPSAQYLKSCVAPSITQILLPPTLTEDQPITFRAETTSNELLRYLWLFDNELQSTDEMPSISFKQGYHLVNLRVANNCGEIQRTIRFQVMPNPKCQSLKTLQPVFFNAGGMELSAISQSVLDVNLEQLQQCPSACVLIQGYAERNEPVEIRSQQRANNVANYYFARGLNIEQVLSVNPQEPTDPACNNQDLRGCRRVESFIVRCK